MGNTIESTVDVKRGYIVKRTWRIVDTDNFGGDYPNEEFWAIGIPSQHIAEGLADAYNRKMGMHSPRNLMVVEHIEIEYKLQPGFEP
jgi:hypothetical protein